MSKTDKTHPYWVKLHRYGIEQHDHRKGECDYDPDENAHDPSGYSVGRFYRGCGKAQPDWTWYKNAWFPRPGAMRYEQKRQHRVARARVRDLIAHERYEDIDNHGTYRNNAMWVCY